MTDVLAEAKGFVRPVRIFLAVSGALALTAGLVLLIWPAKSAVIVTGIFASYLIVGGLVYIGLGIFSGNGGGWARAGHILLGLLYMATGIIAFANLPAATVTFALVVAVFIGVSWIVDGFVALSLLGADASKAWTLLYAVLGIVAGVIVLFSPLYAATVLWILLGASLVVLGALQLVRALTMKRDTEQIDPLAGEIV
ncbi:HdeD family acid-resistance protein [Microbacterium sp. NPDC058345]|uniref:HdeD family acid-resistance protein n=1 Tax=Microbacterium sp. NPDC058345 TaxID=3346455 RepID=UPI00364B655F